MTTVTKGKYLSPYTTVLSMRFVLHDRLSTKYWQADKETIQSLKESTERGDKGFGSTGKQ